MKSQKLLTPDAAESATAAVAPPPTATPTTIATPSTTTMFDLAATASAAAAKALQEKTSAYDMPLAKISAFNAAGHDHDDFDQWEGYFNYDLARFRLLATLPAPSQQRDMVAAGTKIAANKMGELQMQSRLSASQNSLNPNLQVQPFSPVSASPKVSGIERAAIKSAIAPSPVTAK